MVQPTSTTLALLSCRVCRAGHSGKRSSSRRSRLLLFILFLFIAYLAPAQETQPLPRWSLKTNLLYDACLLPSLEAEYRFHPRWSAAFEATVGWWKNSHTYKYYRIASFVPELRYWLGQAKPRKGHYIGLLAAGGKYDLSDGHDGLQGRGWMTGLSYGYQFPVGRNFSFEAGVAVGYFGTRYDKFVQQDTHSVYVESRNFGYFGPLRLRFAWVWHLPWGMQKGGGR